jgi:hypothetical protein
MVMSIRHRLGRTQALDNGRAGARPTVAYQHVRYPKSNPVYRQKTTQNPTFPPHKKSGFTPIESKCRGFAPQKLVTRIILHSLRLHRARQSRNSAEKLGSRPMLHRVIITCDDFELGAGQHRPSRTVSAGGTSSRYLGPLGPTDAALHFERT